MVQSLANNGHMNEPHKAFKMCAVVEPFGFNGIFRCESMTRIFRGKSVNSEQASVLRGSGPAEGPGKILHLRCFVVQS